MLFKGFWLCWKALAWVFEEVKGVGKDCLCVPEHTNIGMAPKKNDAVICY